MSATFSPVESEFSSEEEAQAYDQWFRVQVESSLADSRPNIAHDAVMSEIRALIESKHAGNAG